MSLSCMPNRIVEESLINHGVLARMLSLPSKPWKKVRLEDLGEQRFRIVFLTEMPSETDFLQAIERDLRPSLGVKDELGTPDWWSRSVTLTTRDLPTFKRNMVFACVMIQLQ